MKPQRAVNGALVNQACNKLLKGVIFWTENEYIWRPPT